MEERKDERDVLLYVCGADVCRSSVDL